MSSTEKNPFDSDDKDTKKETPKDVNTANEPLDPRPDAPSLLLDPYCKCSSCEYWTKSADWCPTSVLEFENSPEKRVRIEKKAQPLLQTNKVPSTNLPKIKAYNPENLTKVQRQKVFKSLVHGVVIPEPVDKITETYFCEEIQVALRTLNYRYSLPIQSFVWPAIFRQMNVFMIGSHRSGKTIAYLPAICTFHRILEEKYNKLAKYKGPIVVIICPSSKQCEEVLDLLKKIYDNSSARSKPRISIISYPVFKIPYTDILITIPDSLIHCLKERIFDMKRVCHIILEDTSTLLKKHEDNIYKILSVTNEMLEHRAFTAQVQLIATSEKWSNDIKKLMESLYVPPLMCIANYLEAALYGNVKFEVKFLMSNEKLTYLEGVLRNKYHLYKTVVICDQSEITDINKWLVRNGIKCTALSDTSSKEAIEECETEWSYTPGGKNKVLICTDFVFESLLCITDALWLINYSFSETWTRFTKRFSALSANYKSPLESNEDGVECKSFIMIDEFCERQMAKILSLLRRLPKDLPANCQQYAEGFREQTEHRKINAGISLCETLKLFGKCPKSLCEQRHLVSKPLDVADDLPQCGKIVFKILNMRNVTQYTVQLIEHIDLNECVHRKNNDDLKKPLVYDEDEEIKRPEEIVAGNFYAHCDNTTEGVIYTLCHVLKIERETINVKLINGLPLQTLKNKLFEVPSKIQIVDIIFCNLIPPFNDTSFSGRSFYVAKTSLEKVNYKNMLLTGTIYLQLDKTLWVDNVVQKFNVDDTDVVTFNLTKHLVGLKVVEESKTQMKSLHKLCKTCDIVLPEYVKKITKKPVKKKEFEPQVAFLDDNVHEVILSSAVTPDEFYVRLVKFHALLENLEKDLRDVVQKFSKHSKVEIGKYYIAPDPREETYSRVKLLNVEKDKALCFYVDYGDEAVLDVKKLKTLPTKYLTKLPFQAIQCRLFGLCPAGRDWDNESTDVLYKYMFEPDSDIFRSLFAVSERKEEGDMKRAKLKYSILLKDGFGEKNVLINQLLLDCGLATSIYDKIYDFEIPARHVADESDDSPDSDVYLSCKEEENFETQDLEDTFGSEFDFEIFNENEFFEMLGLPKPKISQLQRQQQAIEATKPEYNDNHSFFKDASVLSNEGGGSLTPEVYWSQTDKIVRLKIKLIGVEQYKTNIIKKRIFTFSTNLEGRKYEVKFTLHKTAEILKHQAFGQEVKIILNKIEPVEWIQLTGTDKRMRFIHYELSDTGEKEVKRKFLQLDITDSESSDDDDKPMYYVCSDMDSEFDHDAFSSPESSS